MVVLLQLLHLLAEVMRNAVLTHLTIKMLLKVIPFRRLVTLELLSQFFVFELLRHVLLLQEFQFCRESLYLLLQPVLVAVRVLQLVAQHLALPPVVPRLLLHVLVLAHQLLMLLLDDPQFLKEQRFLRHIRLDAAPLLLLVLVQVLDVVV